MHILFLTDNFPPETNAPARRTYEHVREWVKNGHRVTIITGAPNFPAGRVYSGYRNKLIQHENMEDIHVIRVWTYITRNEGLIMRTLDYFSFMLSAIFGSPHVKKPDVVIATTPQFFTAIAGFVVAKMKRRPYVMEIRDLWPETIMAVGAIKRGWIIRALGKLARFLYRRAQLIIPVTHSFKKVLTDMGIQPDKIHVITNGVDLKTVVPSRTPEEVRAMHGLPDGKFLVGYVGTIGMTHGLATVLEAAHLAQDNHTQHFVIMGDGADKQSLIEHVHTRHLKNITFLDRAPHQDAIDLLSTLDVALVLLKDLPLFETVIPSKLFEAMALGIPVVLGARGESLSIVNEYHCGIGIRPENTVDLAAAIRKLQADRNACKIMGANGQRAIRHKYNRVTLARAMLMILQEFRP